jgi:putative ABC transport system permease protein
MLRATLKSLAARKLRLGMSAFAIVLGVAFVTGSFVFTDTLNKTFTDIFGGLSADVTVRPVTDDVGGVGSYPGVSTTTLPDALVDEIAALPDVERADGNVENTSVFVVDEDNKVVTVAGAPGIATNWHDGPSADGTQSVTILEGRPPERSGEVAIDDTTAEKTGHQVGDDIALITTGDQARVPAEVVGIAQVGESGSLAGASLALFDTATAQDLFLDGADAFTTVSVTVRDGVATDEVRERVADLLPEGVEAVTGAELDEESISAVEEALGFFTTFLLVFAAVALFVGVFLILNTFTILVAQRTQEMALFRAMGASRRQVTRSVLVEALVVGAAGSTLGLLLGLGVAQLLKAVFASFGLEVAGTLVLLPRTIVVAYVVGILVTMVAAYVPARRAAKVPPIAAMREDVVIPTTARHLHTGLGAGVLLLGAAAMIAGLFTDVDNALWLVGIGILGVFVGVALLAPIASTPILTVIAGWYPRAFGTVGRLARENARRNPRRTAATASALMIGMALVSAISVIGASANASVDRALDDGMNADFVIGNAVGQPFSPAVAQQAAGVAGVDTVAVLRGAPGSQNGNDTLVQAIDPASFMEAAELDIEGDSDLGPGDVLIGAETAEDQGLAVGDPVTVALPTAEVDLRVAGIYASSPLLWGGPVVGLDTLAAAGLPVVDSSVFVVAEPGADTATIRAGLEEITAQLPTVTVKDQGEYAQQSRDQVNQLLTLIYALLGLAVIIAVLGIVNTLALSVMERTREVGLLRAVGLSRRQLRTTVRLESVAIAVLGAVLGIVLGLVFGVALQSAIADEGLEVLSVPGVSLVVFVALSAIVGVLAAVWPARRAARLDILRAITTE